MCLIAQICPTLWDRMNYSLGFPGGLNGKESASSAGDLGLIPRLGRSSRGRHGNPLQYSCLDNAHGQRSLAVYSSWRRKESDMTEWLHTAQHYSLLGSSVHGGPQARIQGWAAIPFSRRSSQPRDQTQVSYIAGGCFTVWATREALLGISYVQMKTSVKYYFISAHLEKLSKIVLLLLLSHFSRVQLCVTP